MTGIASIGWWVPKRRRSAHEIVLDYGLSEEALDALGLESHAVAGPEDHPSSMGARATAHALQAAGLAPSALDLLIFTGITKDWPAPWVAAFGVLAELDAPGVPGFDVASRCAAGIDGLWLAKALIDAGSHRTIAVCCAERFDYLIGPPRKAELASDAAYSAGAATVIVSKEAENSIVAFSQHTNRQTALHDAVGPTLGGSRRPFGSEPQEHAAQLWSRRMSLEDMAELSAYTREADLANFRSLRKSIGTEQIDFVACSPLEPKPQLKNLQELGIGADKTLLTMPVLGHIGAADSFLGLGLAIACERDLGRNIVISTRTLMYSNAIAVVARRKGPGIRVSGQGVELGQFR